ncbi:MAG TPA: hypothetical protein VLG41_08525 [Hydrogenophaga sp.]|uniref:hypothetical protein n=1 Tax=Hydrogenophaga sp. TaxID=1904254 RepID=UPI002BC95992|nr:hypothetical protein [Hydrogenophaga sp.]HSX92952.1 hypothetical protein [Hydrogenophaga sp.]
MNRCLIPLVIALALGGAAQAQPQMSTSTTTTVLPAATSAQPGVRQFPKQALRGTMTVKQPPYLEMDDRVTRFTPGARILDEDNRIRQSAAFVNRELTVNYLMDRQGQVTQVWVLTEAEKKERRPTLGVERNFTFESQQGAATPTTLPAKAN